MASRSSLWRWRKGICKPRPACPPADPQWMAANIAAIYEAARIGRRAAEIQARWRWNLWLAPEDRYEAEAEAVFRLCVVSGHPSRDNARWRIDVARRAVLSFIRQHVIGWWKKEQLGLPYIPYPARQTDEQINAHSIVRQLQEALPDRALWRGWRKDPEAAAQRLKEAIRCWK